MSLRLVVVALILATAAALGLIAYQAAQPPKQVVMQAAPQAAPPPPLLVGYLVAARPLPAGTLARDEDFSVKSVPTGEVPPNAIADSPQARAEVRGALIKTYLDAGTAITVADILRPRDRGFLAAVLAPGTRAVSVGVDQVTGVAGLIWPGDKVDVLLTQEVNNAATPLAKRILSETILRNIRVIAVDQAMVQGAATNSGVTGHLARTVTLEVSGVDAEKLAVAEKIGHLSLAIRAIEDRPNALLDGSQDPTVFGGDVSPALSDVERRAMGARLELIQGGTRGVVSFR